MQITLQHIKHLTLNIPQVAQAFADLESMPGTVELIAGNASQAIPVNLDPAKLPRIYLDANGNDCDPGSTEHVATHFTTAGLVFDVRKPREVKSRAEARQAAAECDLLGRKGDWVVGQDYEMQLIVDRAFHEPAVNPSSFPNMPDSGRIFTDRETAWSSVLVWFVGLNGGYVYWRGGGNDGLVVPVLRVPPSQ